MRDKRDSQKKRFIDALTAQGTVYHAAQAAGISRQTAYRWRDNDLEFSLCWEEASETAVDAVESVLYQKALNGDIVAIIFYLEAHRPKYRDRLNVNIEQVQSDIDEMMERFRDNPGLLNPVTRILDWSYNALQLRGRAAEAQRYMLCVPFQIGVLNEICDPCLRILSIGRYCICSRCKD